MSESNHTRSNRTLTIESMLLANESFSAIARKTGVSRTRVQQINKRLNRNHLATATCMQEGLHPLPASTPLIISSGMKSLTIRVTTPVFDALTEACQIINRKDPQEPITIDEYVEECVVTRLVELGLLRKNKRK